MAAQGPLLAIFTSKNILIVYNLVQCVEVVRQLVGRVVFLAFAEWGSHLIIAKDNC